MAKGLTADVLDSAVPAMGRTTTLEAEDGRTALPFFTTERVIVDNMVFTVFSEENTQIRRARGTGGRGQQRSRMEG